MEIMTERRFYFCEEEVVEIEIPCCQLFHYRKKKYLEICHVEEEKENLPSSHTSNKKKRNYFATRKNVGPTSICPRTYERAAILQ